MLVLCVVLFVSAGLAAHFGSSGMLAIALWLAAAGLVFPVSASLKPRSRAVGVALLLLFLLLTFARRILEKHAVFSDSLQQQAIADGLRMLREPMAILALIVIVGMDLIERRKRLAQRKSIP